MLLKKSHFGYKTYFLNPILKLVKFIYPIIFYNDYVCWKDDCYLVDNPNHDGILVVPMVIIWFTTVHPYLVTHPPILLLGVVDFLPGVPIMNVIGGIFI